AALSMAALMAMLLAASPALASGEGEKEQSAEPPEGLAVLLPISGPIPPMPLELAVGRFRDGRLVQPGAVELKASAGSIRLLRQAAGEPLLRAVYYPPEIFGDPVEVFIEASSGEERATAVLPLDPRAVGLVEVSVEPEVLVKSPGAEAAVLVRTLDADGNPRRSGPPRLTVNVGTVGELERGESPGEWRTTYRPGPARYPEVAVLAAFAPWTHEGSSAMAFGHAALPLPAAIDLPGEVRPRVSVQVEIAGETFGPVDSDRRGRFHVPVIVPPGHGRGFGHSVDRFGNRRQSEIDLRLPATNRMTGAVHPPRLLADGMSRARLVILTVDAYGRPCSESVPRAEAELGSVGELVGLGSGVFVGWYRAPEGVEGAETSDEIELYLEDDSRSRAELEITLLPASPARLEWTLRPEVIPAPGGAAAVELTALDAFGSPVTGALVSARADKGALGGESGASLELTTAAGGLTGLDYHPPADPSGWEDRLEVRVGSPVGGSAASVIMDESVGSIAVVDELLRPVPGATVEVNGRRITADAHGRLGPAPEGFSLMEVDLGGFSSPLLIVRDDRGRPYGIPGRSLSLSTEIPLPLMEPVPVDVSAELLENEEGETELHWSVTGGQGERAVSIIAGKTEAVRRGREGRMSVALQPGEHVMVVDVETGISALLTVQ
ncbi:MAG: hypothetical protein ACOC0J_01275, partial [Myxococcota bacterium]